MKLALAICAVVAAFHAGREAERLLSLRFRPVGLRPLTSQVGGDPQTRMVYGYTTTMN